LETLSRYLTGRRLAINNYSWHNPRFTLAGYISYLVAGWLLIDGITLGLVVTLTVAWKLSSDSPQEPELSESDDSEELDISAGAIFGTIGARVVFSPLEPKRNLR